MLRAIVIFFGWNPFLVSMLSLSPLENEREMRKSSLSLSVLPGNTVVRTHANFIALTCVSSLSKPCRGFDVVNEQYMGSSTRPLHLLYLRKHLWSPSR